MGCAVVSVFGSGDYDRKKKSSSRLSGGSCCCVSFWLWREIGSFFVEVGKFYYDQKIKVLPYNPGHKNHLKDKV